MADEAQLPKGWPEGATLAVSVSVMLEGWAGDTAPGIGPMGNPLKPGTLDLQARSWAEYGPRTGMARLLDVLDRGGAAATVYTSGIVAERYPDLIAETARRGHAIGAHGWTQNTLPAYQTPEEETRDVARCLDALAHAGGSRPAGWHSSRCTPSPDTSAILARAGFGYHADMFDRDLPHPIATAAGTILGMPFTMEVNDMPLYVRYGSEPAAFTRILERIVAGWPRLGGGPACLDVTVHAHVFGRPYGAIELARALEVVRRHDHCWLTHHAEIASLYAAR